MATKKAAKTKTKKRATPRRGTKKTASKRRRSSTVTKAGIGKPLNLLAMAAGATLAWHYRDDARLVKVVKDPKTRYLAIGAAGLALGSGMVAKRLKMPEPLRFALLGAGVAGSVAAVPLLFPKLLPAPKMQGAQAMGRLTEAQLAELRQYVADQRAGMMGRGNVITGRMPVDVITGYQRRGTALVNGRGNVITGVHHARIAARYR